MTSSVGMSMGSSGIRVVRTMNGHTFSDEQPAVSDSPRAEDVAHVIRTLVDRPDAPHSLGIAFSEPGHSARLKAALVEEYVSDVHIISEIAGTLERLRHDAQFPYSTVAVYDLGASGLATTIAHIDSGTVYAASHTTDFSGRVIDDAVRDHLMTLDILAVPRTREEESSLLAFSREIKEALSVHEATQTSDGQFGLMDRRMFELRIIRSVEQSAIALRELADMSEIPPEAIVVVGGGAHIPLVGDVLGRYLQVPVLVPPDPELFAAQGAALYAARVDAASAAPTTARRSPRTLLLRIGIPALVALGLLSVMMWPDGAAAPAREAVPAEVTTGRVTTAVVAPSTTPVPTPPPPAPSPVTTTEAPAEPEPAPYVAPRSTRGSNNTPAPPPPPPPPPFGLPRIELPQIRLPAIPGLTVP